MFIDGLYYYDTHEKIEKWFKYIGPLDDTNFGELYKWRSAQQDDEICRMLLKDFIPIMKEIYDKIDSKIDPNKCKASKKKIAQSRKTLSNSIWLNGVIKILKSELVFTDFGKNMNNYKNVRGVKNGNLEFNYQDGQFVANLHSGYSKFYVSKSICASYYNYDKSSEQVLVWKKIFREVMPERDARRSIKYFLSTGLDEMEKKIKLLELVGGGSNGKSVILDNILYTLGEYATALSTTLITSAKKGGGSTDEDYMQIKGHSFGLMSETNNGDKIIGSRLKSLGESVKTGRKLYQSNESFSTNITVVIATNFPLSVDDNDGGTWRRLICYVFKNRFTDKPDPNCPTEKMVNKEYENLAASNPLYANALFSLLVHWRTKFQAQYNSDIDKVFSDSPTILAETAEYRKDQDEITRFIYIKVVRIYGFNSSHKQNISWEEIEQYYIEKGKTLIKRISAESLAESYNKWYSTDVNNTEKLIISDTIKSLKTSKLKNYWGEEDRNCFIEGFRILERGEKKLPEESYIP